MTAQQKPTLGQKWRGFVEFCHRPKTKFDVKDRTRALILFAIVVKGLMELVRMVK
ncbi:hypothetical protein LQE88_08490 [Acidaminococcus sp. NSJ-142]|jgi:hypothetical protein|uniref:hypothetical protein n=1 Tax=Acidaminococcus TaxID=904 RepID=UPI001356E1A7|nr:MULTISPECIES: hypothetical protein [Acidaminococcus]MCD2436021.1 hypothetical protein [Acidaminococcus hominis]MCH4096510.1 hypothetical protein [Acidaminococcus provencensis]